MKKTLTTILLTLILTTPLHAETIKWGLVLPLSGTSARSGVDIRRGFEMALSERSSKKFTHKFVFEDSQYRNREAVTAAQKLIAVDKVDIIVALWETADGVAPLAERADILHTSIRWNSNIAKKFNNTFTFESTYEDYAQNFAHLFSELGMKKVSFLNHEANGWNLARDVFLYEARKRDITVVSNQDYLPQQIDYRTLVAKALKDKPDVVIVNDVGENLELIARKLKEYKADQMVTGYLGQPINLDMFEGAYYVDQLDLTETFSKKFEKRYGEKVYSRAQLAYDLFHIVAAAVDSFNKKPTVKELVSKLTKPTEYRGASGKITNANSGKVYRTEPRIMKIENGVRKLAADIKPLSH